MLMCFHEESTFQALNSQIFSGKFWCNQQEVIQQKEISQIFSSKFIKFVFCKSFSSSVFSLHSQNSFYRTGKCRIPLEREFSSRSNNVRHVSIGCVVLALDDETLEDFFFQTPSTSFRFINVSSDFSYILDISYLRITQK